MSIDNPKEFVRGLKEQPFRQLVLLPLLSRLGYRDLIEYHGSAFPGT